MARHIVFEVHIARDLIEDAKGEGREGLARIIGEDIIKTGEDFLKREKANEN